MSWMSTTIAAVLVSLGVTAAPANGQSPLMVAVETTDKMCKVMAAPRTAPPTDRIAMACPVNRKDVRMPNGQVVSGFGFYPWIEGRTTHVRVFVMVPAPGAPNRWLHETGDDPKMLRPVTFASYTLGPEEPKRIEEMKALGLEPWVIRLGPAPAATQPGN